MTDPLYANTQFKGHRFVDSPPHDSSLAHCSLTYVREALLFSASSDWLSIITNSAARLVSSSGSWVELEELIAAVSRRESLTGPEDSISSALQGELERILLEAQLECERSRDR